MRIVRTLSVMAVLFALTAVAVHAADQPGMDKMSSKMKMSKPMMVDPAVAKLLEANERKANECWKTKDANTFMSMMDANAMMADPNGFAPVSACPGMMNDLTIGNYTVDMLNVTALDKDVYLVTYTWKGEASYKGQAMPQVPMYCSSVWTRHGKEWKGAYHQETMAPPPAPSAEPH